MESSRQTLAQEPPLELVNSLAPDGDDLLADPVWLAGALARWGSTSGSRRAEVDLDALVELRRLLADATRTVAAGRPLAPRQLGALNRVIGATPVRAQLVTGRLGRYLVDMTPLTDDPTELLVRDLAGAWVSLLRRSHPPRLKLCANGACRRAFYDATRNRARRWCDGGGCGNRERVRRHRAARP